MQDAAREGRLPELDRPAALSVLAKGDTGPGQLPNRGQGDVRRFQRIFLDPGTVRCDDAPRGRPRPVRGLGPRGDAAAPNGVTDVRASSSVPPTGLVAPPGRRRGALWRVLQDPQGGCRMDEHVCQLQHRLPLPRRRVPPLRGVRVRRKHHQLGVRVHRGHHTFRRQATRRGSLASLQKPAQGTWRRRCGDCHSVRGVCRHAAGLLRRAVVARRRARALLPGARRCVHSRLRGAGVVAGAPRALHGILDAARDTDKGADCLHAFLDHGALGEADVRSLPARQPLKRGGDGAAPSRSVLEQGER